jgi:hypothetical protein
MRSAWILAVLCASVPARAGASPEGLDLSVSAAPACPAAAELLNRRLAARLAGAEPPSARVAVSIREGASGLELSVEIAQPGTGAAGSRVLHGESCEGLIEAAALVVAMALKLPPPPRAATPPPIDTAPAASVASAAPPPPPASEVRVGAAAAIDGGTLPEVAAGLGLAAAVCGERLGLGLSVSYFPARRARIASDPDVGGDIAALAAAAAACYRPGPLWLCAGAEIAALRGAGVGVEQPETTSFWLLGAAASARWEHHLGDRVVATLGGELVGHPIRPRYSLSNPERLVHRPGWLSARLWLGAEVVIF